MKNYPTKMNNFLNGVYVYATNIRFNDIARILIPSDDR